MKTILSMRKIKHLNFRDIIFLQSEYQFCWKQSQWSNTSVKSIKRLEQHLYMSFKWLWSLWTNTSVKSIKRLEQHLYMPFKWLWPLWTGIWPLWLFSAEPLLWVLPVNKLSENADFLLVSQQGGATRWETQINQDLSMNSLLQKEIIFYFFYN